MAELKHVNEKDFEKEVLKSDKLVIVDFFATWCGPCKMLGPVLEQVAEENNAVKVVKMDIDENMDIAQEFGLMSVPTLIIFKGGKEVGREIGYRQKNQILEIIKKYNK